MERNDDIFATDGGPSNNPTVTSSNHLQTIATSKNDASFNLN